MLGQLIDSLELPWPHHIVQELPVVKPVVIWGVALCMIAGGQHRRLVAVDGIILEEELHLQVTWQQQRYVGHSIH